MVKRSRHWSGDQHALLQAVETALDMKDYTIETGSTQSLLNIKKGKYGGEITVNPETIEINIRANGKTKTVWIINMILFFLFGIMAVLGSIFLYFKPRSKINTLFKLIEERSYAVGFTFERRGPTFEQRTHVVEQRTPAPQREAFLQRDEYVPAIREAERPVPQQHMRNTIESIDSKSPPSGESKVISTELSIIMDLARKDSLYRLEDLATELSLDEKVTIQLLTDFFEQGLVKGRYLPSSKTVYFLDH